MTTKLITIFLMNYFILILSFWEKNKIWEVSFGQQGRVVV